MEDEKPENIQNNGQKPSKTVTYNIMMQLGIEFALLIFAPLYALIRLGKWLEGKYHSQIFVLFGILLALTISSVAIYKRVKAVKNTIGKL